mmetsp:Transcript_5381/g.15624  ORF Transcript_5381/g.15624 Transcript_5381/m.15624 type:complete len:221 (+) Transcript_5381:148-810(+)
MKMKIKFTSILTVLAATGTLAFAPVSTTVNNMKSTTALGARMSIWSTLGSLEGPSVCWGPEGVIIGHEEIEIKEYDNFDMFQSALRQSGLENKLKAIGPYTLLAPTNSAIQQYKGVLDEETLSYHIILKDVYSDEFEGQLETLNGHLLTCKSEFRKHYADDALIGHVGQTYGTPYPIDVMCENGIIHAIPGVLTPGWDPAGAEDQLTTRRPDMDLRNGII